MKHYLRELFTLIKELSPQVNSEIPEVRTFGEYFLKNCCNYFLNILTRIHGSEIKRPRKNFSAMYLKVEHS